jgi:hypothetical protein
VTKVSALVRGQLVHGARRGLRRERRPPDH